MRNHLFILTAIVMLCLMAVPLVASVDDADTAEVIGIGYDSYSPYGSDNDLYTLDLKYYDNGILSLTVDYDESQWTAEGSGHMGKDSRVLICQKDNDDTRERTEISVSTRVTMLESFSMEKFTPEVLEAGIYVVQIRATSNNALIVESTLIVGEIVEITIEQPEEGSVDRTAVQVPSGTLMTASSNQLILTFTSGTTTIELDTVTATPPSGLSIDGWYTGGAKISSETVSADMTVSVQWTGGTYTYTLSYNGNGGTGVPDDQTYTGAETEYSFTIPSDTRPSRSGYTFQGWSESASGQRQYRPGDSVTLTSDSPEKTLYAVWKLTPGPQPSTYTYTLSFNANGGSGAPSALTYTDTASLHIFVVPSGSPVWTDHEFLGWSDTASGDVQYTAGSSVTVYSTSPSKTVYAVWKTVTIDLKIQVDEIQMPSGSSYGIPFTVIPESERSSIRWSSSDTSVVTVSGGMLRSVSNGSAIIYAYGPDGTLLDSVHVEVISSEQDIVEEITDTAEGGKVIATYDISGLSKRLVNPIIIEPGTLKRVTEDQTALAEGYILELIREAISPMVIIPASDQSVLVPSELLEAIGSNGGDLTVTEGDVTLLFPTDVIRTIGYSDDIEFLIVPVPVDVSEEDDWDISDIDNAKVYDLYILKNGSRMTMTFPSQVKVTVKYEMEEGWDPANLAVYYLDVEPRQAVEFEYIEGEGVIFGVWHFSHYVVGYEEDSPSSGGGSCVLMIVLIVILLILLLLLILYLYGCKIVLVAEGGTFASVPDGWKRENDHTIYRRMRWRSDLVIPELDMSYPEGRSFAGWDPAPEEVVKGSRTYKVRWQ